MFNYGGSLWHQPLDEFLMMVLSALEEVQISFLLQKELKCVEINNMYVGWEGQVSPLLVVLPFCIGKTSITLA